MVPHVVCDTGVVVALAAGAKDMREPSHACTVNDLYIEYRPTSY